MLTSIFRVATHSNHAIKATRSSDEPNERKPNNCSTPVMEYYHVSHAQRQSFGQVLGSMNTCTLPKVVNGRQCSFACWCSGPRLLRGRQPLATKPLQSRVALYLSFKLCSTLRTICACLKSMTTTKYQLDGSVCVNVAHAIIQGAFLSRSIHSYQHRSYPAGAFRCASITGAPLY